MSNWTHVAGTMRIDCILSERSTELDFDQLIGKECLWESPEEIWKEASEHPELYLPMGSEGSLQKTVWTNPDSCYMNRYMVTIFGDLRDHDNPEEIIQWFQNKCLNSDFIIRNAVIVADNEWNGTKCWYYKDDPDQDTENSDPELQSQPVLMYRKIFEQALEDVPIVSDQEYCGYDTTGVHDAIEKATCKNLK